MTDHRSISNRDGGKRSTAGRVTQHGERGRVTGGTPGPREKAPRHLFDGWTHVSERVRSAEHLALFLDFDGTLTPFRLRPEQVRLSEGACRALERLLRHPQLTVFVLSGRRRADVEDRVAVPGVRCYGLHGWEGPKTAVPKSAAMRLLREARRRLRNRLSGLRGVWIEDKGPILGVHVRGAAGGALRQASNIVQDVMGRFEPKLGVLAGNRVWEVMPRELRGKGVTVRALLRKMPAGTLPIYLGDDATDETAFAELRHGITVCVGVRRPTKARFDLRSPQEVRIFLRKLEKELPRVARRSQRTERGWAPGREEPG